MEKKVAHLVHGHPISGRKMFRPAPHLLIGVFKSYEQPLTMPPFLRLNLIGVA
jgi:hypothetical protein